MTTQTPTAPSQAQPSPTKLRRGVVRIIVGAVLGGLGLWLLVGGLVGLTIHERDADGYYMTGERPFRTDAHAIVSAEEISGTGPDIFYGRAMVGPVRISGQADDPNRELFLGLGPADDVERYLDDVEHSELVDLNVWPFVVEYDERPGTSVPDAPGDQDFWISSAAGSGSITLDAELPGEDWRAVVMNADGSAAVDADLAVGATLPVLGWCLIACFAFGALLAVAGLIVIAFGLRAYRRPAR